MKVFKCVISSNEMFSDSCPYKIEGGFYVVKGKYVSRVHGEVDDSMFGGNASAEGGGDDGGSEAERESGIDVILDHRMKETVFGTKKEYTAYMKVYVKAIFKILEGSGKTQEEIDALKADTTASYKSVLANFKEYQFFTGESLDPDGHIAMLDWKDEEVDGKTVSTPFVYYYVAGLLEEKY